MERRTVFDVLKGIGILEVIAHHALGQAGRKYAIEGSAEWWTLRLVNRALHFAIPLFLLVSAALLTQSLVKRPEWGRFVQRRVTRTLWPYLLWSGVFLLFRWKVLHVGTDAFITQYDYPLIGTLRGPQIFVQLNEIVRELLWGKVYFHLYFMVVLLQLAILLPLLIVWSRRMAWDFGKTVALTAGGQFAVYLLQRYLFHFATPASLALWYLPSLLLGVWIGQDMARWTALWSRVRRSLAITLAVSLPLYLLMEAALVSGVFVDSIAFNTTFSIFTASASLLLLGYAPKIAPTRTGATLAFFGRVSLPMFLVHPIVLHYLGGPRISASLDRLPIPVIGTILLSVGVSYAFARLAMALRIDPFLFGQRLPRAPRSAPAYS